MYDKQLAPVTELTSEAVEVAGDFDLRPRDGWLEPSIRRPHWIFKRTWLKSKAMVVGSPRGRSDNLAPKPRRVARRAAARPRWEVLRRRLCARLVPLTKRAADRGQSDVTGSAASGTNANDVGGDAVNVGGRAMYCSS